MSRERKILLAVIAGASVVVAALLLAPHLREGLAPELQRAWVAIRPAGSDVARVGPVELESGTPFTLHAVLEAEARDGAAVFYSEAPRLELGGRKVPQEAVRRWDRRWDTKVLWFTVEGSVPYLEVKSAEDFEAFRLAEFFRPEWPMAWSVPGVVASVRYSLRSGQDPHQPPPSFGTQRYHVRIELFEPGSPLVAEARFKSWGAVELQDQVEEFPTVTARLAGPAGPASRAFGLTQIELPETAAPPLVEEQSRLHRRHLAFSRLLLLREQLAAAGLEPKDLRWEDVELEAGAPWGRVRPGDLLQAGDRVVVLYRDQGDAGRLDPDDSCLDYDRGAAVRRLGEVFVGEGVVRWASLTSDGGDADR